MTAGDPPADGGTYTLVAALPVATTVEVGALGRTSFDAGWYAYVGSALGPGGFARVRRHCELAAGERDTRHWHVDYLLGDTAAGVRAVAYTRGRDVECAVASALDGQPVPGFGASDCDCDSHLRRFDTCDGAVDAVERAHGRC